MRVGRKAARDTTDKWPEHAPHKTTHATRISGPPAPPRCRAGVRIQTSTQPIGNALIEFDTPPTPTLAPRHTRPSAPLYPPPPLLRFEAPTQHTHHSYLATGADLPMVVLLYY